jgi:16S rRNA (adenine(1408)-N(1))-methyltransferase
LTAVDVAQAGFGLPVHPQYSVLFVLSTFLTKNGVIPVEYIVGKQSRTMTGAELEARAAQYQKVLMDVGTGDGSFVQYQAKMHPDWLVIGIDACRENLVDISRKIPANALYLIANAECLPPELSGLADEITVNFAWGSLLSGLLEADNGVVAGLSHLAKPGAKLTIRLNGSALLKEGCDFAQAERQVRRNLSAYGFSLHKAARVGSETMRSFPTTWAKRLAYGRATEFWLLDFVHHRGTEKHGVLNLVSASA